jgi:hypothetical protein
MSEDTDTPAAGPRLAAPTTSESPVQQQLAAAQDAAKLARQALSAYCPFEVYGGLDFENGASEWADLRRYLARGRMHLLLACSAAGLEQVAQILREELFGDGHPNLPRIERVGVQGHEVICPELWRLEDWIDALKASAGREVTSSVGEYQRNQLLRLLKDTAHLVQRRGVVPARELDVQSVMHDYLRACFPDFVRTPAVPWPTKTFKPDGGIPSLKCAIEFKYARTRADVATSTDQIFADATGYAGDGHWQWFVVVFYMTAPLEQPSAIEATVQLAGLSAWDVIVQVGDGT